MKPFLVDVPVLILFFNRPQQLSQVFEQVRNARPSKLFLYQDGPRGEHDLPGIKACREVTDQIDWDCKSPSHVSGEELWLRPIGIHLTKMGFFYG